MADGDKITIEQINWDDSNLPKWATEATQLKIAKALGAMDKTDDEELKQSKKQTQSLKTVVDQVKELNKNSSENSKKLVASLNKKGGDYTKDLVKKNIQTPFKSVNMVIQKFAGKLGLVGAALGAVATAVGFVIGRLKQFTDAFRTVFSMGFRFEQGAMGLAKSALRAEMGIQEYTEILGRFSTAVGVIGTDSFNNLNVALRDNLKTQGLLGMSLAELTEYTGDFADQLLGAGVLNEMNNEKLDEMATTYLKNITAFSQLAKVSRDQISATIKASVSVEAFANRLGTLGPIAQRNVLQSAQTIAGMFAGLGTEFGDQLATTFTTAYGRGGLFFTEAGRQLLAVNRDLYNSMSGIINNLETMTDDDAAKSAVAMFEAMENVSDDTRARLGIIERSNTEYASAARDQIALIRRIEQLREEGALEEFKDLKRMREESKIDPLSIAFINFERVIQRFKLTFNTFFTALFGNGRLYDAIGNVLTTLEEKAGGIAKFILDFAERAGSVLANWIGTLADADSFGEFLYTALIVPIKAMGKAIEDAIVAGWNRIAMDLPWYLGGDGSPNKKFKNDFLEPLDDARDEKDKSTKVYKMNEQFIENFNKQFQSSGRGVGNPLNVSGANLESLVGLTTNQLERAERRLAKAEEKSGGEVTAEILDLQQFVKNAEANLTMATEELARVKSAQASSANKKYNEKNAQLKAQFQELFPYYDFDASVKAGELVKKPTQSSTEISSRMDSGEVQESLGKATDASVVDPESMTAGRMRIMNQYLPMTGSEDPTQSPEQRYYSQSLHLMQLQIDALKQNVQASETIADKI